MTGLEELHVVWCGRISRSCLCAFSLGRQRSCCCGLSCTTGHDIKARRDVISDDINDLINKAQLSEPVELFFVLEDLHIVVLMSLSVGVGR